MLPGNLSSQDQCPVRSFLHIPIWHPVPEAGRTAPHCLVSVSYTHLVTVSMLAVILLNQLVSASIAMPLKKLNNSVKEWETGNMNPSIYIGGSMERCV